MREEKIRRGSGRTEDEEEDERGGKRHVQIQQQPLGEE